jgi:hypothetical protein
MDRTMAPHRSTGDSSSSEIGEHVPAREPERRAARRPWVTPKLATHESLTVLTQHFFGPAGVAFALQIGCGVSGKKFGC